MAPDWEVVLTRCRAGGHVTAQRALEEELVTRNGQLAAREEAKTFLIDRLRATSSP